MTASGARLAALAVSLQALLNAGCEAPPEPEPLVATDRSFTDLPGGLVPGLPDFPALPGAVLVGSSEQNRSDQPTAGFRIKWTTPQGVEAVMQWYGQALPASGWNVQRSNDGATAEQQARISRGQFEGYVAAEASRDGLTEIIVSLQVVAGNGPFAADAPAVQPQTEAVDPTPSLIAPDNEPSFAFGAAGDFAGGDSLAATLASLKQAQPAFMLALGDLSYNSQEAEWCQLWRASFPRLFLLSGNHDSGEDPGGNIKNYLQACPAPPVSVSGSYGKQYYFDYPANAPLARFIMVSPGLGNKYLDGLDTNYTKSRQGYKFVEDAIDSARTNLVKWIFVGMHKNYISPMEKPNEVSRDRLFISMLLAKKVDVILQGHEHGYARSWPLAQRKLNCWELLPDDFDPGCIADKDSAYASGAGTIFHILGTGGKDGRGLYDRDPEYRYFAKSTAKTNGFGHFRVSASRVTYAFERSAGQAFADSYTILASESPRKK